MELLERGAELETLTLALDSARAGTGCLALVSGEAGIGKTSLVEAFTRSQPSSVTVLHGVCDALFTPRPLGPLYDMASQLSGRLMQQLSQQAERLAIFTTFLQVLRNSPSPTIAVVEDVHWADEATLDLIKFLGRRIQQTRCLLILTYRDDELGSQHPLWSVLGEIPSQAVRRLRLARLSKAATSTLARMAGRDPQALYRITGGNPFFVSEVLADETLSIPHSVQAAVLARAARLAPEQRELLDLVSVFPTRAETSLLEAILSPSVETLEACATTGLVRLEPDALAFRHELARRAILDGMAPPRAARWHAAVLEELLREDKPSLARIVHHARLAGDHATVLHYAPRAAEQAAALGAHLEAAAHYDSVIELAGGLSARERVELLEKRAYEYYLTGRIDEAASDHQEMLRLWREEGETEKEGASLRWLSRLAWFQGKQKDAEAYAIRAIEKLETLPPGEELAMACSNRAQLHMLAEEIAQAVEWGSRAIHLAEELGAASILSHALNNVGTALCLSGDAQGRDLLARSLSVALAHDFQEHVARAYTNLGSVTVTQHDYGRAMVYLNQGIAYSEDRDLDSWSLYMRGWRARLHLEQGRWEAVEADAVAVLSAPRRVAVLRLPALAALGTLYVRRGDPRAGSLLEEARDLAVATNELQRLVPVAAARAELAWWQGRTDVLTEEVATFFDQVCSRGDEWAIGELAFWLWRAGARPPGTEQVAAEPYALQLRGDWRGAAAAWEQLGCPYPQALALSDGDADAQRFALQIFSRLGALPAAEALRRSMHAAGIRGIPRGPRDETRQNPAGLTGRQWEVLGLLVEGMSDRDIAEQLHISNKTAGHHVSAILGRLDVATRDEAARLAMRRGWFSLPERPLSSLPE